MDAAQSTRRTKTSLFVELSADETLPGLHAQAQDHHHFALLRKRSGSASLVTLAGRRRTDTCSCSRVWRVRSLGTSEERAWKISCRLRLSNVGQPGVLVACAGLQPLLKHYSTTKRETLIVEASPRVYVTWRMKRCKAQRWSLKALPIGCRNLPRTYAIELQFFACPTLRRCFCRVWVESYRSHRHQQRPSDEQIGR